MGRTLHYAGEVHAKGGEFTMGRNFPILKLQLTSGFNKIPPDNFVASTRAVHVLHSRERKSKSYLPCPRGCLTDASLFNED